MNENDRFPTDPGCPQTEEGKVEVMNEEFAVKLLNEEGIEACKNLAHDFNTLLNVVTDIVPPGRYQSIVRTKLEEACFFAKKGMVQNPALQKEVQD